eukprot:gene4123-2968_t
MPSRTVPTGQDWEPQVYDFSKRPGSGAAGKSRVVNERDANRARQSGGGVAVEKKEHMRHNQQSATAGANAKKIAEDSETMTVATLDPQIRVRIQKARQELNWTQKDLAQKMNETLRVVTDYESGRAVPEERIIVKFEKALGQHLRGAKAGEPMGKIRPVPKPAE